MPKFRRIKTEKVEFEKLFKRAKKKVSNYKYRYGIDLSENLPPKYKNIHSRATYKESVKSLRKFLDPKAFRMKRYTNPNTGEEIAVEKSLYDRAKETANELYEVRLAQAEKLRHMSMDLEGAPIDVTVEEYAKVAPQSAVSKALNPEMIDVDSMSADTMAAFVERYEDPWAVMLKKQQTLKENYINRFTTALNNHGMGTEADILAEAVEKLDDATFTELFYTTNSFNLENWIEGSDPQQRGVRPMEAPEYNEPVIPMNDEVIETYVRHMCEKLGLDYDELRE